MAATQMSVVLEGNIEVSRIDAEKLITGPGRRLQLELVETYIKDNAVISENIPGGMSSMGTGLSGINFKYEFDGLKPNIKSLVLKIVKTEDMRIIDKRIQISTLTKDVAFRTALMFGNAQAKLLSDFAKPASKEGRMEKSFTFEGTGNNMELLFKTLSHEKYINEQITVYEDK